jgi:hypothetical protein
VIVAPPLSDGGVNVMLALALPFVAVPIVGASATLAATAAVVLDWAVLAPLEFVAVTIQ